MNARLIAIAIVAATAGPGAVVRGGEQNLVGRHFVLQSAQAADSRQQKADTLIHAGLPAGVYSVGVAPRAPRRAATQEATKSARDPSASGAQSARAILIVPMMVAAGVLVCACVAAICAAVGRGSAQSHAAQIGWDTVAAGWPRRRHYLLLALLCSGVAAYGSMVPLRHVPHDFSRALERLQEVLSGPVSPASRSNFVANILLFLPIGYGLFAFFTANRRSRLAAMLCVTLVGSMCAALSVAIEFAQFWFPGRITSLSDITAHIIGATAGMCLWMMVGRTITDWVRTYTICKRPEDQIDWLLQAYFFGLLIYCVLPLDLVSSPTELFHKYREGKIALVPFADARWDLVTFYRLFRDVLIFVPVGMLTTTWMTSPRRQVRPLGASVFLGALIVLAVETVQLLVYSRHTSVGSAICGTIGVCVGAWAMRMWRGGSHTPQEIPCSDPVARRFWLWLGLAAAYTLILVVIFCEPFELLEDVRQIKARYHGFLRLPFSSFYYSTAFELASNILKKLLLFAPLGALLALPLASLPVPRPIRRILLCIALSAAAGVATAIEMAQVIMPSHTSSSTDVILCTVGAAVGMFVALRIVDARRETV